MKNQICRNCGQTTQGLYCSNCGQKNDVERLKIATLADSFISTFFGDGAIDERRNNVRYGFLFTLWAIVTRPGLTISEYLEGRRRKYFNPVTILLLLSGFYALVGVFSGVISDTAKKSDSVFGQFTNDLIAYCQSHPAMTYLALLPFTALAYMWIFRKRSDLRYIEYIYLGIFAAIFAVVLLILRLPFETTALAPYSSYARTIAYLAQGWFAISVFKMLFNIGIWRAIWSWVRVVLISYTLGILVLMLILILAIVVCYLFDVEVVRTVINDVFKSNDGGSVQDAARGASDAVRSGVDSLRTK